MESYIPAYPTCTFIYNDGTSEIFRDKPRVRVNKIMKHTYPGIAQCWISMIWGVALTDAPMNNSGTPEVELWPDSSFQDQINKMKGAWVIVYGPEVEYNLTELDDDNLPTRLPRLEAPSPDETLPEEDEGLLGPNTKVLFFGYIHSISEMIGATHSGISMVASDFGGWLASQTRQYSEVLTPDGKYTTMDQPSYNYVSDKIITGNKIEVDDETSFILNAETNTLFNKKCFVDADLWKRETDIDRRLQGTTWNGLEIITDVLDYAIKQLGLDDFLEIRINDTAGITSRTDLTVSTELSLFQIINEVIDRKQGITAYWTASIGFKITLTLNIVSFNDVQIGSYLANPNVMNFTNANGFPVRALEGQPPVIEHDLTTRTSALLVKTKNYSEVITVSPENFLIGTWQPEDLPDDFNSTLNDYDGAYAEVYSKFSIDPGRFIDGKSMSIEISGANPAFCEPDSKSLLFSTGGKIINGIPISVEESGSFWDSNDLSEDFTFNPRGGMKIMAFLEGDTVEPFEGTILIKENEILLQPTDGFQGQGQLAFSEEELRDKLRITITYDTGSPVWKIYPNESYMGQGSPISVYTLDTNPLVLMPGTIITTKDPENPLELKWGKLSDDEDEPQWLSVTEDYGETLANMFESVQGFYKREKQMLKFSLSLIDTRDYLGYFMKTAEVPVQNMMIPSTLNNFRVLTSNTLITMVELDFDKQTTTIHTDYFDLLGGK